MKGIYLDEKPSGRCRCRVCEELIKENQVSVVKGEYKGKYNFDRYHVDCFFKNLVNHLWEFINIKQIEQFKEELTKIKMLEKLK